MVDILDREALEERRTEQSKDFVLARPCSNAARECSMQGWAEAEGRVAVAKCRTGTDAV